MFKKIFILSLIILFIFLLNNFALAATNTNTNSALISGGVQQLGSAVYGSQSSTRLPVLIALIIKALLGLLGIVFIVIIIYAGFLYITSQGMPETIKKAKGTIYYALIGLIIILTAYALASFVTNIIINSTGYTGGTNTGTTTTGVSP